LLFGGLAFADDITVVAMPSGDLEFKTQSGAVFTSLDVTIWSSTYGGIGLNDTPAAGSNTAYLSQGVNAQNVSINTQANTISFSVGGTQYTENLGSDSWQNASMSVAYMTSYDGGATTSNGGSVTGALGAFWSAAVANGGHGTAEDGSTGLSLSAPSGNGVNSSGGSAWGSGGGNADITALFGDVNISEVDGLMVGLFSAFALIALAFLAYWYVVSGIKRGKRAVV
jgi:hypothetical protein